MRALAIAFLIASVSCKREEQVAARPDPAAKKESRPAAVVISRKAPPIGQRLRVEKNTDFSFEFLVGATKTATGRKETSTRLEEVLAVDGMRVTKVRVTYEARSFEEVTSGTKSARPSPVVSKTYLVDTGDAGVAITDDMGKKPPSDELAIVALDYGTLSDDDALTRGIPDTPLRVGDRVPSLETALRERARSQGSPKTPEAEVEVKVDAITATEVVFKIKATFALAGTGMTVPMTGTLNVRSADGSISAFAIDGKLEMGDAGALFTGGSGTTKLSGKRTYL